jgi:hypothetical protein
MSYAPEFRGDTIPSLASLTINASGTITLESAASILFPMDGTGILNAYKGILSDIGSLSFAGTSSGTLTFNVPPTITTYNVTWPSTQASGTQFLSNNGSGILSWASPSGANSTLSNLTSPTAINQSLVLATTGAFNLGSPSIFWNGLYVNTIIFPSNGTGVISDVNSISMLGSTSGTVSISPSTVTSSYNLIMPNAQASGAQFLQNDGAGNLSWQTVAVNAINQLTGDVTAGPATGSESKAATIEAIQGNAVAGTTGTGNVVFSDAPTFTGTISLAGNGITEVSSLDNISLTPSTFPFTASGTTVYINSSGHPNIIQVTGIGTALPTNTPITFTGSNLPAPLIISTTYYSSGPYAGGFGPANSIQIWSAPNGPVVPLTTTGSGSVTINYSVTAYNPISVTAEIDPAADSTYNLGSSSLEWNQIFASGIFYPSQSNYIDLSSSSNLNFASNGNLQFLSNILINGPAFQNPSNASSLVIVESSAQGTTDPFEIQNPSNAVLFKVDYLGNATAVNLTGSGLISGGTASFGSSDQLTIDSSGDLATTGTGAFGTSTPVDFLTVKQANGSIGGILLEGFDQAPSTYNFRIIDSASNPLFYGYNAGLFAIGSAVQTDYLNIRQNSNLYGALSIKGYDQLSTTPNTRISDSMGNSLIYVYNNGYIGIGTASPLATISIAKTPPVSATASLVNLTNTALVGGSSSGTYLSANPASAGADFINYQVNGSSLFKVDSAGDLLISSGALQFGGVGTFYYDTTHGGFISMFNNVSSYYLKLYNNGSLGYGPGYSNVFDIDSNGNTTVASIQNTAPQTTLTGSAGTAVCSQPERGSSYKKVIVYLNGYTDTGTQTYTFPVAFVHTPYVYGISTGVAGASATTTTVTFTVTAQTGFVFLEGY